MCLLEGFIGLARSAHPVPGLAALAVLVVLGIPDSGAGDEERSAVAPAREACAKVQWIEVHKSARRMDVRCHDGSALTFPVSSGRGEPGSKRRRGDRRTPEGAYHIAGPARPSRFFRFIPLDYPSRADAAEALADGRLDAPTYLEILEAHTAGRRPPQDTPLGGRLGLHGESRRYRGVSGRLDWTNGCLALRNEDVAYLAERLPVGTPVYVLP